MRDPLEKEAGNFPRWKKVCFWKLRLRTGGRKSESEGGQFVDRLSQGSDKQEGKAHLFEL